MTPEEHNKALGICHLAYGGLSTVIMLAMFGFMWVILDTIPKTGGPEGEIPTAFFLMMFGFLMVYSLIFTLPSYIAGYAMLKHKPWARTASIIAAVLEVMSVPIGTAVGVYSFWFMFSEQGKAFYNQSSAYAQRPYALHDAPPLPPPASNWNAQTSYGREHEYVPPTQPPDWRDQ